MESSKAQLPQSLTLMVEIALPEIGRPYSNSTFPQSSAVGYFPSIPAV